ncbi:MAG: HflC protein [Clostridiales bacterium]|nr:prohibitin family protein [Clostridiales bacterium]PWM40032.1 MAG: HflC protein [Clostridiales bacterium]
MVLRGEAFMKTFNIKKIVISVVIALAVLVVGASSLHAVPAGHTGVVTRFGAVDDTVLSEGLHVVIPFVTRVVDMNNQVTKAEVVSASASKDLQTVNSTVALNYRIESLSAASVYQNIGVNYENVVVIPAIQEAVKSVMAQYTAEELITLRQTVGAEIQEEISSKLTPYGFSTQSVNIVDFQFSEEFNAAIEAKQTAQQNALKAEQDLARVKVEAEQKIAEAQAEAESYRLKSQEITDQMLKMEFIDKWDGKLPVVVSDGQSLFNIDSILDSAASSAGSTSDSASSTTE